VVVVVRGNVYLEVEERVLLGVEVVRSELAHLLLQPAEGRGERFAVLLLDDEREVEPNPVLSTRGQIVSECVRVVPCRAVCVCVCVS